MSKRDIFAELTEGFAALASGRQGKVTLKQHSIKANPAPDVRATAQPEVTGC